ncbi:MAG: ATP-dependent DNA helicase PcrA, partial [Deltaproteobacteria bacterium]
TYQFNPPSRFLAEIPQELLTDFEAEATSIEPSVPEHNLSSLADLVAESETTSSGEKRSTAVQRKTPNRENTVPESGGLKLGAQVRHVKFGIGTVRRLEGSGDKQKVIVYFNSVGSKKLLMKFAGLMPV